MKFLFLLLLLCYFRSYSYLFFLFPLLKSTHYSAMTKPSQATLQANSTIPPHYVMWHTKYHKYSYAIATFKTNTTRHHLTHLIIFKSKERVPVLLIKSSHFKILSFQVIPFIDLNIHISAALIFVKDISSCCD